MNHEDNKNIASEIDFDRLAAAINALRPGKQQQKALLFQKLLPLIEQALAREVPQKVIVAELEKMGLPLSLGGFRSLLEAERKRRAEAGDAVRCEHCGSILPRDESGT